MQWNLKTFLKVIYMFWRVYIYIYVHLKWVIYLYIYDTTATDHRFQVDERVIPNANQTN